MGGSHLPIRQILLPFSDRSSPIAMQTTRTVSLQGRKGTTSTRAEISSARMSSTQLEAVPSRRWNYTIGSPAPRLLACVFILLGTSFAQTAKSGASSAPTAVALASPGSSGQGYLDPLPQDTGAAGLKQEL